MVKYLLAAISIALLLIPGAWAISKAPIPSCNSPKVDLQDLPISIHETQSFNMNNFFTGYNLNITIPTKPDSVFIREKSFKVKDYEKKQEGLRSYQLRHYDNYWGESLITLSVQNHTTKIRWGYSQINNTIPDLDHEVVVETEEKTHCYDAVLLDHQQIAMVDCMTNTTFGNQNVFIYVNRTTKQIIGRVNNDMYVPYTVMHRRRIRFYSEAGYHYIIRCYFADSVDKHFDHNTYAEIISINKPMEPWTVRVMDRSFLLQDKLSIMDFKIYLGDIYLLDFHSGIIQFDITTAQKIIITGRYRTDSGFSRFGVYSNNLDNECLLVLAHDHAIFEIDWSNHIKPEILTKYSIPEASWIHSLWVNEGYVVVQIEANLTTPGNTTTSSHSTFVLTRGSRTYLNAYVSIPHPNMHAFADFNRDMSQVMAIDSEGIDIYQLSTPALHVIPVNPDLLNKEFSFVIKAESTNEYGHDVPVTCTFTMKFRVVDKENLTTYPTGLHIPQTYNANYPGQLFIPLNRYVLGSNITYGIQSDDPKPPSYFILQQNETLINWNKEPSLFTIRLFRQEQYDSLDQTIFYIYMQDYNNKTDFAKCRTVPYTSDVHCDENSHVPHINNVILNLTVHRFHYYEGKYLHLAAVVVEILPNKIFIYDVENNSVMTTAPIMFPKSFEGQIQSMEFLGHYLVVVLRYVKEIVFFDMIQCHDHQQKVCQQIYRINATTMYFQGVKYFSPLQVVISDFHPFVLFIQCIDKVVIADITRKGPIVLAVVDSPATQEPGLYQWKMGIARGHLVLVNPPYQIEEHSLEELYTRGDVSLTKSYPIFNYEIPHKFDLDFSDSGDMIYITAIDKKLAAEKNSVILVYRSGFPAAASFYDVFHVEGKYQEMLIDATGSFGDYVGVTMHSRLMMFRQYEVPIVVFQDTLVDYSFKISYTNDPEHRFHYLQKSSVKVANYPQNIIITNATLNNSNYLTDKLSSYNKDEGTKRFGFEDATWYNGSVINYTLTGCDECNKKVRAVNHVSEEREVIGTFDMEDYAFTFEGGVIQQFQSLMKMYHNGSIDEFVTLPSVFDGQSCTVIEYSFIYDQTISACKQGNEVYLYTTTYTASKPFVNGPYYSSAKHVTSLSVEEDLLILVDVDENFASLDRQGGVIIYAINHDPFELDLYDEIEYINSDDLTAANGWKGGQAFIGNAHFAFSGQTDIYRLIITELNTGFFMVDFKWTKGRKSVEILKIEFINLLEELIRIHMPLPNMAHFTAVALSKETYVQQFSYWRLELIIATSSFHHFQVNLNVDKTGTIADHSIAKIFYRYGFYHTNNYIKTFDGYFAVTQTLPVYLQVLQIYSQEVLTVYDTKQRWSFNESKVEKQVPIVNKQAPIVNYHADTNIPIQFLLGGYTFSKGRVTFDFNFTFTRNKTKPFEHIGLLTCHNRHAKIREMRIRDHLHIEIDGGIQSTQNARLRAQNDFFYSQVPLDIVVQSESIAGWGIALIVIGSLAGAAIIGYVLYLKCIKSKKTGNEAKDIEKSLLEIEAEQSSSGEESEDEEGEQESGEQEEQQQRSGQPIEQEVKPEEQQQPEETKEAEPVPQPVANEGESINRETITSVDNEEKKEEAE